MNKRERLFSDLSDDQADFRARVLAARLEQNAMRAPPYPIKIDRARCFALLVAVKAGDPPGGDLKSEGQRQ